MSENWLRFKLCNNFYLEVEHAYHFKIKIINFFPSYTKVTNVSMLTTDKSRLTDQLLDKF